MISFGNAVSSHSGLIPLKTSDNSPESFLKYLEETIDKFTSTGKNLCLLGDFNLCLQKIENCNYSRDFLLALQSCYLLPTIDKPTRVHKNSASLIDNIFVNNPEQVLISGNLITDVSDHFSQLCILSSTRDKIKRKQIKNAIFRISIPTVLTATLLRSTGVASLKRTQRM